MRKARGETRGATRKVEVDPLGTRGSPTTSESDQIDLFTSELLQLSVRSLRDVAGRKKIC